MRSEYRRHLPPRGEQHEQLGPSAAPAAEGAVRDVHEGALEGRHGSGLARAETWQSQVVTLGASSSGWRLPRETRSLGTGLESPRKCPRTMGQAIDV
jgi:hypothetical protein